MAIHTKSTFIYRLTEKGFDTNPIPIALLLYKYNMVPGRSLTDEEEQVKTCYTIVTKAHGGRLTVKSELEQGARSIIFLLSYWTDSQSGRYGVISSFICTPMKATNPQGVNSFCRNRTNRSLKWDCFLSNDEFDPFLDLLDCSVKREVGLVK